LKILISWRNYDEIQELKAVVNDIIEKRDKSEGLIMPDEIRNDFEKQEQRLRKRIQSVYPKVRRWTNLTTVLSVGAFATGLASGIPELSITGAAIGSVSKGADAFIKYDCSKHNWLGFKNKNLPVRTIPSSD
jgi:hypothetical protein